MFVEDMDRFLKMLGSSGSWPNDPWNVKPLTTGIRVNTMDGKSLNFSAKPVDKIEVNLAGVDPSTIQAEWTKYSTDEGTLLTIKYGDGKDKKYLIDKIFDASKTKLTYSHGLLTINFVEKESNVKTGVLTLEY